MDCTSSLLILRDFTIRRERPIVRDDLIIFGQLAFRKTARTNYLVDWFDYGAYRRPVRRYYTLDSLVFLLFNADLDHAEYHRRAADAGIFTAIKDSDWANLLAYLNGSISTTSSIDYNFVPSPEDLPVPPEPRQNLMAAQSKHWTPVSRTPAPKPLPIPKRIKPAPKLNPGPVRKPSSNGSDVHDPFMWLLVSALVDLKGPSEPKLIANRIQKLYPVNRIIKVSGVPIKRLLARLMCKAVTGSIIQRVRPKKPLRYQLCPGVNPADFPVPSEPALASAQSQSSKKQKNKAQPKSNAKKKNSQKQGSEVLFPVVAPTDFIPSIASTLRTLNNRTGSTAAEIRSNIQEFFFPDALRRATGMKLKVLIATAVGLAVAKNVVESAGDSSEVPFPMMRFKLRPALASTSFSECAEVGALRRTRKEPPESSDNECIIIDDEDFQFGFLGPDHGEMWALIDRALKALEKTGACNGQMIFGTVSMLKESESNEVSPWKCEGVEAVLLWGVRMGVYVKNGEQYRMSQKADKTRVQEIGVVSVMEVDKKSVIPGASEEVLSGDYGALSLPSGAVACSSVTLLEGVKASLPVVFEISDSFSRAIECDKDDCVIMEVENERDITGPSRKVQDIDQGGLCFPPDHTGSPAGKKVHEAVASLPSLSEISGIVTERTCFGSSDDSTSRAQMEAYQSFASSVYR